MFYYNSQPTIRNTIRAKGPEWYEGLRYAGHTGGHRTADTFSELYSKVSFVPGDHLGGVTLGV